LHSAGPDADTDRDPNGDADRRLADDVAGDRDVAQVGTPAEHHAVERRALDDVAGRRHVGLDGDADAEAGRIGGVGALAGEVADDVAGDGQEGG